MTGEPVIEQEFWCTKPMCGYFASTDDPCPECGSPMTPEWEPLNQRVITLDAEQSAYFLARIEEAKR